MNTLEIANIEVPYRIAEDLPLVEAIRLFNEKGTGALLVEREGSVVGIITKDDVIRKVMGRRDPKQISIGEVMTPDVPTLDIRATVAQACSFACKHGLKYLVVTQDGGIAGIVPISHLIPAELVQRSLETEEFFNRVGVYGEQLLSQ